MKFDTEKKGLLTVFKQYQISSLETVFGCPQGGATSGMVHNALLDSSDPEDHKSRASVIFFLNDMVDEGILDYVERTGKGGYHRVYYRTKDVDSMDTVKRFVARKMMKVINSELLHSALTPVEP